MHLEWLIGFAYDADSLRVILPTDVQESYYDLLLTIPKNAKQALRDRIKKQLGLVAHQEMRPTDVLLLEARNAHAPGIHPGTAGEFSHEEDDSFNHSQINEPISSLVAFLKGHLATIVLDHSGLTGNYNLALHWKTIADYQVENAEIKQNMLDQLGLELVPTNMPIEMLVVEKLK